MSSEATQFRPGQSGNPAGRPKGARNKITVAIEALIDAASTDIATKAIELAKAGDATMIRALLDRAAPPRRDRHIPFELPPMERAADAVKAAAAIAQAVADGELTPSEASELSDFVANYAKALEISDLEARLQRLEAAANGTRR
jgi:Family of unknown function (DUF5681)